MKVQEKIEMLAIAALVPYARNSRTHSPEQIAQIARSIQEFGFTNPVLIDGQGGIVAGHGRVLAAQSLGVGSVPCLRVDWLTEAQKRAYVIADNQLALNAGWDDAILADELRELQGEDFDLNLLGFGADELIALLADPPTDRETDLDATPEPPAVPVSRLGDVWVMGKHRLICGSSTDADTVAKVLNGVQPHLMVTDPPYGVEYDAGWRNEAMPKKNDPTRRKDGSGRATGAVMNDDNADWREAWALFPGEVAYVWHAMRKANIVADSLESVGFEIRAEIVWAKSNFVLSQGNYHPQHESCWYAVKKSGTGHWSGCRKQTTLWQIPKPAKSETGHSTQKPVECMKRPIENNSVAGQAVYEPFSGSGTTIIAAEMTARCCYAIELSPAYVDVAVRRWQEFTRGGAVLEGDGRTFSEIAGSRAK